MSGKAPSEPIRKIPACCLCGDCVCTQFGPVRRFTPCFTLVCGALPPARRPLEREFVAWAAQPAAARVNIRFVTGYRFIEIDRSTQNEKDSYTGSAVS